MITNSFVRSVGQSKNMSSWEESSQRPSVLPVRCSTTELQETRGEIVHTILGSYVTRVLYSILLRLAISKNGVLCVEREI